MTATPSILQTPHEVIPVIPEALLLRLPAQEGAQLVADREEAIRLSREDPFEYGYELPMWAAIDLEVAERRLAIGGAAVIMLVILGGIRAAKTHLVAKRLVQHMMYGLVAWVWALHETEDSSQTIGQRWVHHYLPAELKTVSGKAKGGGTRLNYELGKGFTGMQFKLGNAPCEFKVYGGKPGSYQGAELSMAWADELVTAPIAKTLRERTLTRAKDMLNPAHMRKVEEAATLLRAGKVCPPELLAYVYHGVVPLTFTPKEGYSPLVSEVLDGAVTTKSRKAPLLPIKGPDGTVVDYKEVPLFKRARKRNVVIAYLHSDQNPFGNYEGLCEELEGANEDRIRIDAYGDVRKTWAGKFTKFNDQVHVISLTQVPRAGSCYMRVDPCDARNFFISWWLVVGTKPAEKHYCIREWPQEGDYIPGVGDPGEWAVTSQAKKFDGDMGPAQECFGFSLEEYKAEFERVELELGAWFYDLQPGDKPRAIEVYERHMDSRFGNAPTVRKDGNTTLIEEFDEIDVEFLPAPGENLQEGVTMIISKLAYNESRPVGALNTPHYFLVDTCLAMIFAHQNWTGKDGEKGACKDCIDTARYHVLADPQDMSHEPLMVRRGRAGY